MCRRACLDLQLLVLRAEPRVVDLLGEPRDRRALVAQLLLQAGDVVAQLALDRADAARAYRRDLGVQRLPDGGQVCARQRELVGARAKRRLDLVASLVRGARGIDVALELVHVPARGVRPPPRAAAQRPGSRPAPRRATAASRPQGRRARIARARRPPPADPCRAAARPASRSPRRAPRRDPRRGSRGAARFGRLVMLALQSRADEVARGLALGGRGLERERGVVAHTRERTGRIGEQRIVGDRRARQPARGRARRRPGARTTARATSRARTGRGGRARRRPPSAGAPSARRTAQSPPRRTRRARTAGAGTGAGP